MKRKIFGLASLAVSQWLRMKSRHSREDGSRSIARADAFDNIALSLETRAFVTLGWGVRDRSEYEAGVGDTDEEPMEAH